MDGWGNGMNIGVISRLLGHASIQVTLDSYATVIDELMMRSVGDLRGKMTIAKNDFTPTDIDGNSNAKEELIQIRLSGSWN